MGPACSCPNTLCPAVEKHASTPPRINPVDRALPPLGYYESSPPQMTQSWMQFRGSGS